MINADYLDGLDSTAVARVRRIPFTLAAGASTASIALPPGLPVHLMGGKSDGVGDNLSGFGVATLIAQTSEVWWIGSISYSWWGVDNVEKVRFGSWLCKNGAARRTPRMKLPSHHDLHRDNS
jgi:hypothetical protein